MALLSILKFFGKKDEVGEPQAKAENHEVMNMGERHLDEMEPLHIELEDTYTGKHQDNVLYADITPSSERHFSARFRDCTVFVKELKILDSYDGIYEGIPNYIAMHVLERAIEAAAKDKLMSHKVIFPKWQRGSHWPLLPYQYEMTIQHYEQKEHPEYYGQSDWYFLKLVWFDYAPASNQSLSDYINSITSLLDFFAITRKLTEEEKDSWC